MRFDALQEKQIFQLKVGEQPFTFYKLPEKDHFAYGGDRVPCDGCKQVRVWNAHSFTNSVVVHFCPDRDVIALEFTAEKL